MSNDRLARLRADRREIESRLQELEARSHKPITDPDLVVDAVLEGLKDAKRLFTNGTMEERKRVVRTFVEGLVLSASKRSGELQTEKHPTPAVSVGCSLKMVAGVRLEVRQGKVVGRLELVILPLRRQGTALAPVQETQGRLLQSVV